jgi:2-haloacid dehalogenase
MSEFPLIVFDVNETLLDLTTMEPTFERIFNQKGAVRLWFANLILYSAALTVARQYVPFTDIGFRYANAGQHARHSDRRSRQAGA